MSLTIEKQTVPEFDELEWKLALARTAGRRQRPPYVRIRDDRATPETIPPERLRLASANIKYLSAIIRQLVDLRNATETDEYGALGATQHAFDAGCHMLTDAAILAAFEGRPIPSACASTDSQGGVRIEWVRPTTNVHLVIPATTKSEAYIYHEVGSSFATEPATAEALARWLLEIKE